MKDSDPVINQHNVDWSLTTWDGARREQMRRWAALPLERSIMALEEMETLAKELRAAPVSPPMQPEDLGTCATSLAPLTSGQEGRTSLGGSR